MSLIEITFTVFPVAMTRVVYFYHTLASLRARLHADGHKLRWICATETQGVDPEALLAVEQICVEADVELFRQTAAPCLGKNINLARQQLEGNHCLYVQDDWELVERFDINESFRLLEDHPEVLLVAYHKRFHLMRGMQPIAGHPDYVLVGNSQPFKYNDNPYLATRAFYAKTGPHPDKQASVSEREFDTRVRDLEIPVAARKPAIFRHLGEVSARKYRHFQEAGQQLEYWDRVAAVDDGQQGHVTQVYIDDAGQVWRYEVQFDDDSRRCFEPLEIRPVI